HPGWHPGDARRPGRARGARELLLECRAGPVGAGDLPGVHQAGGPYEDGAHQRRQDVRLEDGALRHSPAPPPVRPRCPPRPRAARDAGHEVGLSAWDHVTWQDRLHRMSPQAVAATLDRGMAAFAEIFGARPQAFAAPAWFMTDEAFLALTARGFDYISVSRG